MSGTVSDVAQPWVVSLDIALNGRRGSTRGQLKVSEGSARGQRHLKRTIRRDGEIEICRGVEEAKVDIPAQN